jgi:hypothetical protein
MIIYPKLVFIVLLTINSVSVSAQFYDNHWMMGYSGGSLSEPNDSFGVSILSFYEAKLEIINDQNIDLFFQDPSIALSDFSGNLSLYSNAIEIRNEQDAQLINGNFGGVSTDFEAIGTQSILFLPTYSDIENTNYSFFKMWYTSDSPRLGKEVKHSRIDIEFNGGIGQVYDKNELIVYDSLATGELTACKHANGRDWWILIPRADRSIIYSILVTPFSVQIVDTITTNYPMDNGLGQSVFSPNGEHYIRVNLVNGLEGEDYLDIFDFDRCTGQLSNHRQASVGLYAWAGGVAVSPSSQYLYVSHYNHVYQYDLWAEDIFATKDTVATYDGYTEWGFFTSRFFQAQLAPDGKIYLNNSSGVKTLHVINQPDVHGEACHLAQHAIQLPNNNAATLANHPNYRLGPLDGSPCDTLSIDNLPRAYFRTDRNATDTLAFHFQDLSFYEPTTWFWTFGDGNQSNTRHPNHVYAQPGIFEVCLTVSNTQGSDTHCRTLELGTVGLTDVAALSFSTFPNPVREVLVLDLGDYYPLNGQFRMFNAAGQQVFHQQVLEKQVQMNLVHLPSGLYFYELWDGGQRLGQGKVVKQ